MAENVTLHPIEVKELGSERERERESSEVTKAKRLIG